MWASGLERKVVGKDCAGAPVTIVPPFTLLGRGLRKEHEGM